MSNKRLLHLLSPMLASMVVKDISLIKTLQFTVFEMKLKLRFLKISLQYIKQLLIQIKFRTMLFGYLN